MVPSGGTIRMVLYCTIMIPSDGTSEGTIGWYVPTWYHLIVPLEPTPE